MRTYAIDQLLPKSLLKTAHSLELPLWASVSLLREVTQHLSSPFSSSNCDLDSSTGNMGWVPLALLISR